MRRLPGNKDGPRHPESEAAWVYRDGLYAPHRSDQLPWVDKRYRGSLISKMAILLVANARAHVTSNFRKRFRMWCLVWPVLSANKHFKR